MGQYFTFTAKVIEAVVATAAIVATAAAAGAAGAGGGTGGTSGTSSFSGMSTGSVPSGVPQPGTGNEFMDWLSKMHIFTLLYKIYCSHQDDITELFNIFLVGGGLAFSPATQTAGGAQALAAALVPAGLTPVAYFPSLATQQLQAVSVIFLEAPIGKRKKRHLKPRYNNKGKSYRKGHNLMF